MRVGRLGDGSEIEWLQVGNTLFQERVLLTDYFSRYFEGPCWRADRGYGSASRVVEAFIEECFVGRVAGGET